MAPFLFLSSWNSCFINPLDIKKIKGNKSCAYNSSPPYEFGPLMDRLFFYFVNSKIDKKAHEKEGLRRGYIWTNPACGYKALERHTRSSILLWAIYSKCSCTILYRVRSTHTLYAYAPFETLLFCKKDISVRAYAPPVNLLRSMCADYICLYTR